MAVNQQTGYPAISLPHGAYNLPDKILGYLNKFTKIILWMDND
jgi:twinkle protein